MRGAACRRVVSRFAKPRTCVLALGWRKCPAADARVLHMLPGCGASRSGSLQAQGCSITPASTHWGEHVLHARTCMLCLRPALARSVSPKKGKAEFNTTHVSTLMDVLCVLRPALHRVWPKEDQREVNMFISLVHHVTGERPAWGCCSIGGEHGRRQGRSGAGRRCWGSLPILPPLHSGTGTCFHAALSSCPPCTPSSSRPSQASSCAPALRTPTMTWQSPALGCASCGSATGGGASWPAALATGSGAGASGGRPGCSARPWRVSVVSAQRVSAACWVRNSSGACCRGRPARPRASAK